MSEMGKQFREWVLSRRPLGCVPVATSDEHIEIACGELLGECNIYDFGEGAEIVELRATRAADQEPLFFLHFMLEDMGRAQELFLQLEDTLTDTQATGVTKVLLCCTSAFTTTMFANRMQEAARALSLDYEFTAAPVEAAMRAGDDYVAILLAPQVAHLRREMAHAHPKTIVFEIPPKVFGSYDAGGALRLLMQALREEEVTDATKRLSAVRDLTDDARILIVTLFILRENSQVGYRLYDRGRQLAEGSARKSTFDYRDIEDLLDTLVVRDIDVSSLDAIGIAVPGVVYRGSVELPSIVDHAVDLGQKLSEKYGVPVYVDNNCNAAVAGCYVGQDEYESIVFYRHAFGHTAGGFGTVIDGKLLKGRHNVAGEPKYFESRFAYDAGYEESLWSEEGMLDLATNICLSTISLISPDAIFLSVDTIDDPAEFKTELARHIPADFVPDVFIARDYTERVYLGELALCLQRLRDPYYRSLGVR
jgi:cellobiose-specific phosphotransferase system component IIB